jgi:hypothetical protein
VTVSYGGQLHFDFPWEDKQVLDRALAEVLAVENVSLQKCGSSFHSTPYQEVTCAFGKMSEHFRHPK